MHNTELDQAEPVYMNKNEIRGWKPYQDEPVDGNFRQHMTERLKKVGHWNKTQLAGRRWGIGCVSLEITQRCNLDCSLCYLSDSSEAVKDVPLEEIFRRLEQIRRHYGPNTDIQVSGGDPTLRDRKELVQIVQRITDLGMRSALFTNGIKATRDLLEELCEAGLSDVAFHVDLTQERKGYKTEEELNKIREEYIARARGLPLMIIFNTTVYAGNFKELPMLIKFFRKHSQDVRFVSFQLQADTGRGVLRERDFVITQESVMQQIRTGAETNINFDVPMVGHPKCNKYSYMFSCNGNLYDIWDKDDQFLLDVLEATKDVVVSRKDKNQAVRAIVSAVAANKNLIVPGLGFLAKHFWRMKKDLVLSGFRVNKLSFFIHNFMDACKLEEDRINGCVFMVATKDGPLSMCMHNAKRDEYILAPLKVHTPKGERVWNPLTGKIEDYIAPEELQTFDPRQLHAKHTKGRVKQEIVSAKQNVSVGVSVTVPDAVTQDSEV